MAKLGDEFTHNGVTYVLVDAELFTKLNPNFELLCEFCALDSRELEDVCVSSDCVIDNSNADTIYVKKLEEADDETGR